MKKWTLHSIVSILMITLSLAMAPFAWADDSDSDDLGVDGFDVVGDSDSEEGSFLALSELRDSGGDDLDSDSQDSDGEDSDSDDSDGDLPDSDSEDDSDGDDGGSIL